MNINKLTKLDRYRLIKQLEILSFLSGTNEYDKLISALKYGYEQYYDELIKDIRNPLPEEETRFVDNVLEMYWSFSLMETKNPNAQFLGFCGNTEREYVDYCKFSIETLSRFDELRRDDGYNSHCPSKEIHKKRLERWMELSSHIRFHLSEEEISLVLG